jgi:hypothetical protein
MGRATEPSKPETNKKELTVSGGVGHIAQLPATIVTTEAEAQKPGSRKSLAAIF